MRAFGLQHYGYDIYVEHVAQWPIYIQLDVRVVLLLLGCFKQHSVNDET
jgi:hypothetical protein